MRGFKLDIDHDLSLDDAGRLEFVSGDEAIAPSTLDWFASLREPASGSVSTTSPMLSVRQISTRRGASGGRAIERGAALVELEPVRAEVLDARRRAEAQAGSGCTVGHLDLLALPG